MEKITICLPVRFEEQGDWFLERLRGSLRSYKKCDPDNRLSLSVGVSGNIETIKEVLVKNWEGRRELIITEVEGKWFSIKNHIDAAAHNANTQRLFINACDIIVPNDFLSIYDAFVEEKTMWFPIPCMVQKDGKETWRESVRGILGIHKNVFFDALGGWGENKGEDSGHPVWGKSDPTIAHLARNLAKRDNSYTRVRSYVDGLIHFWHPRTTTWHTEGGLVSEKHREI